MAALSGPALAAGAPGASPAGDWLVAEGLSVMRVAPCGDAFCGKIAWTPGPGNDQNNPDPAKRNQPMVGTTILIGMKPAGNNKWQGEIYNPQDGKTYSGSITLLTPDILQIEGCVLKILCGGENWTRTGADPATVPRSSGETSSMRPAGSSAMRPAGDNAMRPAGDNAMRPVGDATRPR